MEGIGARKSEYERLKLQKALENFRYRDDKRLGNAVRRPFSRGSDVLHHRARGCVLARDMQGSVPHGVQPGQRWKTASAPLVPPWAYLGILLRTCRFLVSRS